MRITKKQIIERIKIRRNHLITIARPANGKYNEDLLKATKDFNWIISMLKNMIEENACHDKTCEKRYVYYSEKTNEVE